MARERWVWREGLGLVLAEDAPPLRAHNVMSDLPAYRSPLGTGWIDGRAARREDLKRGNCREVDPGEYTPRYVNPSFALPRGLPLHQD